MEHYDNAWTLTFIRKWIRQNMFLQRFHVFHIAHYRVNADSDILQLKQRQSLWSSFHHRKLTRTATRRFKKHPPGNMTNLMLFKTYITPLTLFVKSAYTSNDGDSFIFANGILTSVFLTIALAGKTKQTFRATTTRRTGE